MTTKEWINSRPETFRYMLLSRLQSDCDYYLGYGNRYPGSLWAGDEKSQIDYMLFIYNSLSVKPEWLSREQLIKYGLELTGEDISSKIID